MDLFKNAYIQINDNYFMNKKNSMFGNKINIDAKLSIFGFKLLLTKLIVCICSKL